jgi:hypothetical protein
MNTWRTDWMQKKQTIALRLSHGDCGGSYAEAVIILCAALSALAADVWPGRRIDRARFVELIKEFSPPGFDATKISIPILVGYLRRQGRDTERKCIENKFLNYDPTRVLIGDEVDRSEDDILTISNTLSLKELRECSYPNLLYAEIRSGYAHEYRPGVRADSWPMTAKLSVSVSYVNLVGDPDRHIHFHVNWISNLAVEIAKAVDAAAPGLPRQQPSRWWING